MKTSKFEQEHLRENAGAGYDISASRSDSNSQAANQQAGTIFNFGSGSVSEYGGSQSATPASTAVAARNAGPVDSSTYSPGLAGLPTWAQEIDWKMVAIAAVALAAIGGAIYYATKKP